MLARTEELTRRRKGAYLLQRPWGSSSSLFFSSFRAGVMGDNHRRYWLVWDWNVCMSCGLYLIDSVRLILSKGESTVWSCVASPDR